jgi:hypothetical protein
MHNAVSVSDNTDFVSRLTPGETQLGKKVTEPGKLRKYVKNVIITLGE